MKDPNHPNERQVGGQHYKGADFQPWDWPLYRLGYWETDAVKYITRFRKKKGVECLKKALHFIDKTAFHFCEGNYLNRCEASNLVVLDYAKQNKLDIDQLSAVMLLVQWREHDELMMARQFVLELIAKIDQQTEDEYSSPGISTSLLPRITSIIKGNEPCAECGTPDLMEHGFGCSWQPSEHPRRNQAMNEAYALPGFKKEDEERHKAAAPCWARMEEENRKAAEAADTAPPTPPPYKPLPPFKPKASWDKEQNTHIASDDPAF